MARRNKTRFAVLGMIARGVRTGFEMKRYLEETLEHFWSESYGQLYPELKRLESEGLAKKKVVESDSGADRKEYELTRKGRRALSDWLAEPVEAEKRRNELLLKITLGAEAGESDLIRHVQQARADAVKRHAIYRTVADDLEAGRWEDDVHARYWALTVDYGLRVSEAELAWAKAALEALRKEQKRAARKKR